jgi:hypothetical protein
VRKKVEICGIFAIQQRREAEESPLLKAVARKWLMKTLQAEEDLMFAAVICETWRFAIVL